MGVVGMSSGLFSRDITTKNLNFKPVHYHKDAVTSYIQLAAC